MERDPKAKFWVERNVACWRRAAAFHDRMSRTAGKPGLRLYHAERAVHAHRMADAWKVGTLDLRGPIRLGGQTRVG